MRQVKQMFWELSVGQARGREANLDPLNMAPISSDKQQPRQTSRP